jgi:putative cell wall-binding protein
VSQKAFPEGALAVVLATDRAYPDALAGAPLAARLGGPLLLNGARELAADVAAEIARLRPAQVVILGTADVVSDKVLAQVRALGVADVTRIGGASRFDTMLGVARMMKAKSPRTTRAVVVSGRNWADAAAVAPVAAANGWPIVLTEPDSVRWQTLSALAELGATSTVVVGGTGAVSDGVAGALPAPERIWGADRYGTAAALATWSLGHGMLPDRVMVASGENFPDALTSASLGQHLRSPLLLTRTRDVPQSAIDYVSAHHSEITRAFAVGGSDVVSEQAWSLIKFRADVGTAAP